MISARKIEEIVKDCLFSEAEFPPGASVPADAVIVEGIIHPWGFNPQRLESHRDEVKTLLADLPDEFQQNGGGGMSFLNACMDREGNHWGEHRNMDQLFSLGIGLGLAKSVLPREMWSALPGGMPYYVVLAEGRNA